MMAFDANSLYDIEKTKAKYDALWRKCNEIYGLFKNANLAQHADTSVILSAFAVMIREIGEHTDLVPRHMALMHSDFITKVLNMSAGLTSIKNDTEFDYAKMSVCDLPICSFMDTYVSALPATCYADIQHAHTITVDLYEIWVQPEFDFDVFVVKIREFLAFAGTTPELSRCKAGLTFIEQCLSGIADNTTEYYKTYMSTGSSTNTIMDIFSDIKLRAKDSMSKNKYKIIYDIQKIGTYVMNRANSNQTPIVTKIKENLTTCLDTLKKYLAGKKDKSPANDDDDVAPAPAAPAAPPKEKSKRRRGKRDKASRVAKSIVPCVSAVDVVDVSAIDGVAVSAIDVDVVDVSAIDVDVVDVSAIDVVAVDAPNTHVDTQDDTAQPLLACATP